MSATELKIILKGDEWTFTRKFLVYEDFSLSEDDPYIQNCIKEAEKSVYLEPEDVSFKISKVMK